MPARPGTGRTDLLLLHEGVDPSNEAARQIAWVFMHRTEVYVAGAPADAPRYRFIAQVPEGQYDDERRAAVTKAMTDAVVKAEAGRRPHPEARVWVFTNEVPNGTWGGMGQVFRRATSPSWWSAPRAGKQPTPAWPNATAGPLSNCSTPPRNPQPSDGEPGRLRPQR